MQPREYRPAGRDRTPVVADRPAPLAGPGLSQTGAQAAAAARVMQRIASRTGIHIRLSDGHSFGP